MTKTTDRRLSGKVALITGGGRGLGRAAAEAFGREGAALILCSRSPEAEKAALELEELGVSAFGFRCDVSDAAQVRRLVADGLERFGRLDIVVNNAGLLGPRVALADYPPQEWERVISVNLSGAFHVTQAAAALCLRAQRSGCIINVGSGAGRGAAALGGAYAVSKLALEALTRISAQELKEFGIRVNTLNPGPTRTAMRRLYAPNEDPATVKEPAAVAGAFVALAADESGPTGQCFAYDPATGLLSPAKMV